MLDPIDFLALQSIQKALEDMPGSAFFAQWDFTSDPCGFSGVFCDSGKVIALNLGDPRAGSPGLTGRIDTAIGELSELAEFSVVPGRIYSGLPPSLSGLKNIRFLAVSRNYIIGQIPANLGQLRRLKTLDLSYNQLAGEGKYDKFTDYIKEAKIKMRSSSDMDGEKQTAKRSHATRKEESKDKFSNYISSARNRIRTTLSKVGFGKGALVNKE